MNREDGILSLPLNELKRLQNKTLRRFVNQNLYPFSPYYRRLFDKHRIDPRRIRTVEDLKNLPLTSKSDLIAMMAENPDGGALTLCLTPSPKAIQMFLSKKDKLTMLLAAGWKGKASLEADLNKEYRPVFITLTAGTTAKPIPFLYTVYDMENLKSSGKRLISVIGAGKADTAVNVFPYAPHLAFWQTVFAGMSAGVFIFSTGGGKVMGMEGNLLALLKFKPRFLIGVPSYVYHILKAAREKNMDLSFLNRIVLGASNILPGFKTKVSKLLGEMGASDVRVFGTYGFTESRTAWAECPTEIGVSSGYHIYPDKEVFEVIDPGSGKVMPEGQDGEIVYTGIDARGSSVFRYRTGDLVKGGIVYAPCPHCGRTVPRISSDIVRVSNIQNIQFSKIKGSLVNLNELERILDGFGEIDEWQIEIVKKDNDPFEVDEMILYVGLLKQVDTDAFTSSLNEQVLSKMEVSFNGIRFVSHQEIGKRIGIDTEVKARRIVDRRQAT